MIVRKSSQGSPILSKTSRVLLIISASLALVASSVLPANAASSHAVSGSFVLYDPNIGNSQKWFTLSPYYKHSSGYVYLKVGSIKCRGKNFSSASYYARLTSNSGVPGPVMSISSGKTTKMYWQNNGRVTTSFPKFKFHLSIYGQPGRQCYTPSGWPNGSLKFSGTLTI